MCRKAVTFGKLVAVLVILLWSLLPIVFIVTSSLKSGRDIFATPPRLLFSPTLVHYRDLWTQWRSFFTGLINSAIVTAGATILAVAASSMAGFAYSRLVYASHVGNCDRTRRDLVDPPIVLTLPLFPIVNWLDLADTHLLLIILYATFFVSMGSLLMRNFIDQIPRAAR